MLASILGSFLVRGGTSTDSKALSHALHLGTNVAMGITAVATVGVAFWLFGSEDDFDAPIGVAIAVIGGLVVGWALGKTAEYYTSDHYPPVKKIADQTETGPATTVLGGISVGMISVGASVLLIILGVGIAYWGGELAFDKIGALDGGIYGIAVAAIGMLATLGVVVSVDAYGPIADNAGGIAEMAELDPSVREVTDALDSLGNTTAAIAKGFAVGSAALTALALFKSFEFAIADQGEALNLNVGEVDVFIGLFIGAMLPFVFAALTIDAVGRAAQQMIEEVRRQFREIPGLREGKPGVNPDSARCVAISTEASLKEMIIPGSLAVVVPLVVGFIDVDALGGLLAGRPGHRVRSGDLHGQRRWCLGQRQEVHRGRSPRWQGRRSAQGGRRRRHRRRSVQGHLRPLDEHPHQGHDDRVPGVRLGLRVAGRRGSTTDNRVGPLHSPTSLVRRRSAAMMTP